MMKNLAGDYHCDKQILEELHTAGLNYTDREIIWHKEPLDQEVPASYTGQLYKGRNPVFTFTRAWYYWIVTGDVPLEVARKMYEDPVGKKDVRVAGHCGCPPPEEWAFPKMDVLVETGVLKLPNDDHPMGQGPTYGELAVMCNSGQITAPRYVDHYHIDSQEGLDLFVRTIREHGLAD